MPRRSPTDIRPAMQDILDALAQGERLPTERALADNLQCSRQTVRLCLAKLEKDGEIWRHLGQGTFRGLRLRHLPVRDTPLIEGATPPDIMRARIILEPMIVAETARLADASDASRLREKVGDGRRARDGAACEQADDAFHRALVQISGNPILLGFLTYLSGVRRRVAWQREWEHTYRRIGTQAFQTLHSDQHERIVDAIEQGDAEAAASCMNKHLETIRAHMSGNG